MYWPYGNRLAKNPNIFDLHMLIRQILSIKILILGQNQSFWKPCRLYYHWISGWSSWCKYKVQSHTTSNLLITLALIWGWASLHLHLWLNNQPEIQCKPKGQILYILHQNFDCYIIMSFNNALSILGVDNILIFFFRASTGQLREFMTILWIMKNLLI